MRKETSLHQLSPYIGKIKSAMAAELIAAFTNPGDLVYDPFCGSGTVALEAWLAGRHVVSNDLSPYARLLTRAKLKPYKSVELAMNDLLALAPLGDRAAEACEVALVPTWIGQFFHPETLREILGWARVLRAKNKVFLLACLMGILHHQRPGFLSFPSSHTVPYLRVKKFPRRRFPRLYAYRSVQDRLEAKVRRAFKRIPELDYSVERSVWSQSADAFHPRKQVNAIITSPPYMHQLDYGRDNRLRLWFLGAQDWKALDAMVSPPESQFLNLMRSCLKLWRSVLHPRGKCVLVLGDLNSRTYRKPLPQVLGEIAVKEIGGYRVLWNHTELIPNERRVRRGRTGSISETVLALERKE